MTRSCTPRNAGKPKVVRRMSSVSATARTLEAAPRQSRERRCGDGTCRPRSHGLLLYDRAREGAVIGVAVEPVVAIALELRGAEDEDSGAVVGDAGIADPRLH